MRASRLAARGRRPVYRAELKQHPAAIGGLGKKITPRHVPRDQNKDQMQRDEGLRNRIRPLIAIAEPLTRAQGTACKVRATTGNHRSLRRREKSARLTAARPHLYPTRKPAP